MIRNFVHNGSAQSGPPRVARYTRVSTEEQAKEGFSLESQQERLLAYIKSRGWVDAGEYVDDGFTGRDTKRPAYRKMMAEMHRWDILLVVKMDRIHRNMRNFMAMTDELRDARKEFASVSDSWDTSTATGRFCMDILQRVAMLESDQIGERVFEGTLTKMKKTKCWPYPVIPGYKKVGDNLQPNPDKAAVVAEIFVAYDAGTSIAVLVDWVNARTTTSKGNPFNRQTMILLLRQEAVIGIRGWGPVFTPFNHPGIVDPVLFKRVQERMDQDGEKRVRSGAKPPAWHQARARAIDNVIQGREQDEFW